MCGSNFDFSNSNKEAQRKQNNGANDAKVETNNTQEKDDDLPEVFYRSSYSASQWPPAIAMKNSNRYPFFCDDYNGGAGDAGCQGKCYENATKIEKISKPKQEASKSQTNTNARGYQDHRFGA